jgi:hypothetical protein
LKHMNRIGMNRIGNGALALMLVGNLALLSSPSIAVEPDVDSPAGPELPAPRTDRPDFQLDDQTGAPLDPMAEGADPTPPDVVTTGPDEPAAVIVPEADKSDLPKGKTEDSDPSD